MSPSSPSPGNLMHPKFHRADELSKLVIGAAIEVHRLKGPGLLESIYEKCLMRELELRSIPARRQVQVPIEYKGLVFEESLKLDVYVEDCLILELKVVTEVLPIHKAQLLSYMKLVDGLHRLILPGADGEHLQTEASKASKGKNRQ